jgi:tRNA1(Val) A37 N6-methylase TrmN6
MPAEFVARDLTDDAVLGGRLRLLQPRAGHRFGHDAILLAAATGAKSGERAVDLGAGVGTAGLALAARIPGVSVALVDIDDELVGLARENAARNGLSDRVSAFALDVGAGEQSFVAAGLASGAADHVLMNPPFHDLARRQASPDPRRRQAHVASREWLNTWMATAGRLLRIGGTVTLIFAADGIVDVLVSVAERFRAVTILPIYPKPEAAAIRILVRAIKGGRGGFALSPALLLNRRDGRSTPEAESILREAAALPFVRPD